jgi:NTE family protein
MTTKKKFGMALGGGGSRCFAHLGAFEVLAEKGLRPSAIVAASTGSIIGALVANNVPLPDIHREFARVPNRLKWYLPNGFLTFSQRAVRDILHALLPQKRLEHCPIPLALMGTNLNTGALVEMKEGDLVDAVCASCCHPAAHRPFKMHGSYIVDGGILDSVPADVCRRIVGSDAIIIASSLEGPLDRKLTAPGKCTFLFRSIYIPLLQHRQDVIKENADVVLEPLHTTPFNFQTWRSILHFESLKLLEHYRQMGRHETQHKMGAIERALNL